MIVKTLVENTSLSKDLRCEHGLSLFIKTKEYNILFDVGAGSLFYENAKKLEVDISKVDYLIISHGHFDHGGGLNVFLNTNKKAEVFIHKLAFKKFYALYPDEKKQFIGLVNGIIDNPQIILTADRFFIGKGLEVFSNVFQDVPQPKTNKGLVLEEDGKILDDKFHHEQNLILEEEGKRLLVTGCAHNGIVNIVKHFYQLKGYYPDYVIGGFHLSGQLGDDNEGIEEIKKTGEFLLTTKAKYYTGHCTGLEPYQLLRNVMGEMIEYIPTGSVINI